jgi:hypothetical protein
VLGEAVLLGVVGTAVGIPFGLVWRACCSTP